MTCPTCRLTSYVVTPHAARPHCPHCDADLLPALVRPLGAVPDDDSSLGVSAA